MIDGTVIALSRTQFALTALYHFLFVPLTLGLSMILVIMEAVYVMTGREIWKRMTRFWGVLFGINFAMGVATGITMEFQFGTNWAYYSHYVGDIFGAPLAIEGLMAFFLESTFVGLFFFGWERLSKVGASGGDRRSWRSARASRRCGSSSPMPGCRTRSGAQFNPQTMRMELGLVRRGAVQSRGAGEVRAYRRRRLRGRLGVRARDQRLVPAARAQRRYRPALDGGGRELRARLRAVGGRARR